MGKTPYDSYIVMLFPINFKEQLFQFEGQKNAP